MGARGRRTVWAAVIATILVAGAPVGATAAPGGASGRGGRATTDAATWRRHLERVLRSHGDRSGLAALGASAPATAGSLRADGTVSPAAVPTIEVSPSTDLASGDVVTLSGSGWSGAGDPVPVVECDAAATDFTGCDLATLALAEPTPDGAISTPYAVHRVVRAPGTLDCATDACAVAGLDFGTGEVLATAAIAFDPAAPLPHPQLHVEPATGLLHGQAIVVSGSGWRPGSDVFAGVCAQAAPFCGGSGVYVQPDASGAFSVPTTASLRVIDEFGELSDCLTVTCELRAEDFEDPDYFASAAVAFDPSQPPPPVPAITVEPDTGLAHDQTVTVSGTGFDPGSLVEVSECPAGELDGFCADYLAELVADGSGAFTTEVSVSRLTASFSFVTGTTEIRDCAVDACVIQALGYSGDGGFGLDAAAPIAFDPSLPPPVLPEVTAAPLDALPYRANVTVTGDGFAPGEFVFATFCATGLQFGGCFGGQPGLADESGHAEFTIAVRRLNGFGDGEDPIDCADPAAECSIQVQGEHSYETWTFPLTFDPEAPVPPPPTATVTPDRDLGYRQTVTVAGQGFLPGPVAVSQCADATGPIGGEFPVCVGATPLDAGADGTVSGTFPARRIVTAGYGDPVDCAQAVGRCHLVIGGSPFDFFSDPLETVRVDLGFDPDTTPPPPPPVTVDPTTGLHDGQTVSVRGSGFTPDALIGLTMCAAGTTTLDRCDLGRSKLVPADGTGAFATDFAVGAAIDTGEGTVDCTAAPGACVLGVANIDDYLEYSLTPLSFSVPDLEVHSVKVTEGTGGVTAAPVAIELSDPAPGPITVHWRAEPGTATAADYTATSGSVSIPAGATDAVIPAEVVADALDEPTERFTVRVTGATGARVTDDDATVKIHDDDAEPEVNIGDWHAAEGDGVAYTLVGLTAPSGRPVTVEWKTHHDSARSGRDFERTKGTITFAPGQAWSLFAVPLVDDAAPERTERFRIELRDADEADIGDGDAVITITDDDS